MTLAPLRKRGYTPIQDRENEEISFRPLHKGSKAEWVYQHKYDPQVVFLGTSSMSSSFFRNVSGILLRLPGDESGDKTGDKTDHKSSILLDCG